MPPEMTQQPTVNDTLPPNPEPPAGDPGSSPPASPPAGDAGTPPVSTPPADATTTEPAKPADRVALAPTDYKLPMGAPAELGEWASQNGFTQAQLDASMAQFSATVQATKLAEMKALQEQGKAHIEKWGSHGQEKLSLARSALVQVDTTGQMRQLLKSSGYANHPAVLDFLATLGQNMREGGFLKTAPAPGPKSKPVTVAQALYGGNHPSKQ